MSQKVNNKSKVFDLPTYARAFDLGYKVVSAPKGTTAPSEIINNVVVLGTPSFVKGFYAGMKKKEQELKAPETKKVVRSMLQDLQKRFPNHDDPEFKRRYKEFESEL